MAGHTQYIERVNGGYRLTGTRVSLDSIIYLFQQGLSPESIAERFPAASLEQVYGAIAYYLGHQEKLNQALASGEAEAARRSAGWNAASGDLIRKIQRGRLSPLSR